MWTHVALIENLHLSPNVKLPFSIWGFTIYPSSKFPHRPTTINYLRENKYSNAFTYVFVARTTKYESITGNFIKKARNRFEAFILLLRMQKPNWMFLHYEIFLIRNRVSSVTIHDERPSFLTVSSDTKITKHDMVKIRQTYLRLRRLRSRTRMNKILNSLSYMERGCKGILAERIIWLFTALESVFNLNEPELTYKLSTRIAWFLEIKSFRKRMSIFKIIKDAYNYRSRIVHGDTLNANDIKKHLSLLEIHVWSLMKKILLDIRTIKVLTGDQRITKAFFDELILGRTRKN